MNRTLFLVMTLLAASLGCDDPKPAPESQPPRPQEQAPANDQTEPTRPDQAPAAPRATGVSSEQAQGILEQWLKAQNDGDFEAYSSLYAKKFEGIKRVGPKTFKYDHDGWLEDRGRMFKKNMKVSASEPVVRTAANTAVVRFVQTWESGDYKDVGSKQLVLSKVDGALRIVREEMLSSHVLGAAGKAAPYDPRIAAFAIDAGVVIDLDPPDIGTGPVQSISRGTEASQSVDLSKLPPVGRAVESATFRVVEPDGEECTAKVDGFELRYRIIAHFATVDHWDGEMGDPPATDAQVAREVAELAAPILVATLSKSCDGVWATISDGARAVPRAEVDDATKERALDAFRELPGYQKIQQEYARDGYDGPWDTFGSAEPRVSRFGDYLAVSAAAGMGCGDFYGDFWAIWEVEGERLTLLTDPAEPGDLFHPTAVMRPPTDDKPIFVDEDRIVRPHGTVWRPTHSIEIRSYDCPC